MHLVEVIVVGKQLKVRVVGKKAFVRFPKNLRKPGKIFSVETLIKKGSYYIASGEITEFVAKKKKVKAADKKHPFVINLHYSMDQYNLDLDQLIAKQAKKVGLKMGGSGAGFGERDMDFSFRGTEKEATKMVKNFRKLLSNLRLRYDLDCYNQNDV